MSVERSSLEQYWELQSLFSGRNALFKKMPSKKDIIQLLDYMKWELIQTGSSSLMNAAISILYHYYERQGEQDRLTNPIQYSIYVFEESNMNSSMSLFDASFLVSLLADYMNNAINHGALELFLKKVFKNNMPNYFPYIVETCQALNCIDGCIRNLKSESLGQTYLHKSNAPIVNEEQNIESSFDGGHNMTSTQDKIRITKDEQGEHFKDADKQVNEEESDLLRRVKQQAESERDLILNTAKQEANEILRKARLDSDLQIKKTNVRIAQANAQIVQSKARSILRETQERKDRHLQETQWIRKCFVEVKDELIQTNACMKKLEDSILEMTTKKIYIQYLELFNLIADSRDSAWEVSHQTNNQDLENTAYNLEAFLDMITEYLSDFGIQTVITNPGERFSAKFHSAENAGDTFDPRLAMVKRSLRRGFVWGEQVLQKEKVEV